MARKLKTGLNLIQALTQRVILEILILADALLSRPHIDNLSEVKNILVMRRGAIGDILMSTPFLRALRNNLPQANIAYMVGNWSEEVLIGNPCVDEIIPIKSEEWFDWKTNISGKFKIIKLLRKKKFDVVFILNSPWSLWLVVAWLSGARYRVGLAVKGDRGSEALLTHKVYVKSGQWDRGNKHRVQYNLDLLRTVGIGNLQNKGIEMSLSNKEEEVIKQFLRQSSVTKEDLIIGIAPGGAVNPGVKGFAKRWPMERFIQLSDALTEKYSAKIIFIGGLTDAELVNQIMKLKKSEALNATGKFSIKESASLIRACDLFICNDSGPMHMAVAVGTPVIAIFGPTNPKACGPWGSKAIALRREVACDWSCLNRNPCKGFDCMSLIKVDDVMATAEKQLSDWVRYLEGKKAKKNIKGKLKNIGKI